MNKAQSIIIKTYNASAALQPISSSKIKKVLRFLADAVETNSKTILNANKKDLAFFDPNDPKKDRLMLNDQRLKAIADSIRKVSKLPDQYGKVPEQRTLYNGLKLEKRMVPLGVVGAIYESRPNVTFDIAALCLRSLNTCVLKGSSEAIHTNEVAVRIIKKALKENGMNPDCVNLLPANRESVKDLFGATKYVDVIIPRGSEALIQYVRKNSRVPVIETGAGVCHVYVEKNADINKAVSIVVNAKVSRPSVCNALDVILADVSIAKEFLNKLQTKFREYHVELFAEEKAWNLLKGYPYLHKATDANFRREYLSLKCAVKLVKGIDEALQHIREYSTKHSESIVSENRKSCDRFLNEVDAAVVYCNASTRFTDGEVFGLGAEIGISTQKLHARGPFALEKLVTEKWVIKGEGQVRE